jgi:hypothetical protein
VNVRDVSYPAAFRSTQIVLASLGFAVLLFVGLAVFCYRHVKVIKASSLVFTSIILLGGVCAYTSMILIGFFDVAGTCVCFFTLVGLAFQLVFGSIFLHIWSASCSVLFCVLSRCIFLLSFFPLSLFSSLPPLISFFHLYSSSLFYSPPPCFSLLNFLSSCQAHSEHLQLQKDFR